MIAFLDGSPVSLRPPTMNASTSIVKLCESTTASGSSAKHMNVAITKGFLPKRSAIRAAGR